MSGNNSKKIAFNYFGGKFSFIEYLYENFPPKFTHLVDLFAGSMVVSLNYRGNVIRTANEINGEITNFFEQLREHEDELIRMLELHALNSNTGNAGGGLKESQTLNALDGSMSVCGSRSSDWVCNDKIKGGTCPNNT